MKKENPPIRAGSNMQLGLTIFIICICEFLFTEFSKSIESKRPNSMEVPDGSVRPNRVQENHGPEGGVSHG